MADTFYSTWQEMAAMVATNLAPWTVSNQVDGSFYAIKVTNGTETTLLRDAAISSGATAKTTQNFVTSWENSMGVPQLSAINSQVGFGFTEGWYYYAAMVVSEIAAIAAFLTDISTHTTAAYGPIAPYASPSVIFYFGVVSLTNTTFSHRWITISYGNCDSGDLPHNQITDLELGQVVIASFAGYNQTLSNYKRNGAISPDLGVCSPQPVVMFPGVNCCDIQSQGDYPAPTELPNSWIAGPYNTYYFCPESLDIYYPGPSQML